MKTSRFDKRIKTHHRSPQGCNGAKRVATRLALVFAVASGLADTVKPWDPKAYGAKADAVTLDTKAIQAAIDAFAAAGGGTVLLRDGIFRSGTVILKSGVTLSVNNDAVLRGSLDVNDYPDITPAIDYLYRARFTKYLIYAERQEDIGLTGDGVIDGQGAMFPYGQGGDGGRPYILRFSECKKVRVSGLLFLNSARWLSHFLACEDVLIERVAIRSRIRENRDGIDVDSCDGVVIRDCDIYAGDDAIVLKATVPGRPCRDVRVSACRLSSLAAALKLGTESQGGYEDIVFQDCFLYDTRDGICVEEVDGGECRRVNVSDIVMRDVDIPIFVRLGDRGNPVPGHPKPGMGTMSDITISNVRADNAGRIGCSVTGIPGHPVERVTLRNIKIRFSGGGTKADAERVVPVKEKAYPRGGMFGVLPAFGLYVRHVEGIALHDLDLQFTGEDARPAIVIDTGVAGLKMSGVTPQPHKR